MSHSFSGQSFSVGRSAFASAVALAALTAALVLGGCTPDTGPPSASEGSSAPSAGPNAAAAARTDMAASSAATAARTVPAAGPKRVAPQCPPAAHSSLANASAARPEGHAAAPAKPIAAPWSSAARRLWSRHHPARHGSAWAERRDWDLGRPWPGDHPGDDRFAARPAGHDELMGGPGVPPARLDRFASEAGGVREESHETVRTRSWRSDGGESGEIREAIRPCLDHCGGPRRFFGYAGIDDRGYLVWPGKVEY